MDPINRILKRKKVNFSKLLPFGFKKNGNLYTYYCDELEFLWQKFPDNAVWRRKDNKKWYGALLTVSKEKLGLPSKETTEIIDLRLEPDKIASQIDRVRYFPGWHMNKKSWYTIILDGSVETAEICSRIHNSFLLAQKSK